jgi:8-oxo-dGTP pyrophosphatase MutT (NUDIX family)
MSTDPPKSEPQRTGPKRRSAGVVVLRRFDGEWCCLLLRCYRYWDFSKGELEPGEDPLLAARREVAEEAGLQDLNFRWGQGYVETPPYSGGKVARYYLAECAEGEVVLGINPELGRPEHQEYRWVPVGRAEAFLNERLRGVLNWVRARLEG